MSYEYFLQAHLNGESQEVETEKILAIFKPYTTRKDETTIDLKFDDVNHCTIYIDANEPTVNSIMVSRPCGSKLGKCLYQVMQLGNFVFFEPDGKSIIILTKDTKNHLPEDMIKALRAPVIASNLEEFLELYDNNRE